MSLRSTIKNNNADTLLLEDPTNIFYLTGLHFSTARLLVSKNKNILFVDDRYAERAKKEFKGQVVTAKNLDEALANYLKPGSQVAISSNHVTLERYLIWKKMKLIKWVPVANLLSPLRMIKSPHEIQKIKAACDCTTAGFEYLLKKVKVGVSEKSLSQKLHIFFLEQGADLAFPPIIAFGDHSSIPHHSPTDRPYKKGEIIQFDIGCKKESYCSDFSRVHAVPKELSKIEKIVQRAKEAAEHKAVIGKTLKEVDEAAREVILKEGYGERFLHTIGHGVGLDIHETPLVKADPSLALQEGMVITIEPGIYLEGIGGVRLEDTYLITKKGLINLTEKQHAQL